MPPTWDPILLFGLQPDEHTGWMCIGSTPDVNSGTSQRCQREIHLSEIKKAQKLILEMSSQIPDQVDHNVLLHLARACLCVDVPEPHRGSQEADVIYRWTSLMSREAEAFRVRQYRGKKASMAISPLDTVPTPKAFASPEDEGPHEAEPDVIAPVPISTPARPAFPSLMLGPTNHILSPTIRMRRSGARDSSISSPTSTLTIVPPFAFPPSASEHYSLPPSPPDSATSTLAFPSAPPTTGPSSAPDFLALPAALLAPLPTSTTIETGYCSSSSFTEDSDQASSSKTSQYAQGHGHGHGHGQEDGRVAHAAVLTSSALLQLEEYNRLLQETHARHVALLEQVAALHHQLSQVNQMQVDLRCGLAQLMPTRAR